MNRELSSRGLATAKDEILTTTGSPVPTFNAKDRTILALLLGAGFLLSADYSIFNVALPAVGSGVGMPTERLAWVVSAYTLPAAGAMLLFGRLADLFGRRKLFMLGMSLLACASLVGGFATDPEMLLTARVLQGASTAMALPAAMSIITTTFAEGALRDRALGLNGAILSGGFTAGALLGGALVEVLSWRAAFFINVPLALLILVASPVLLHESTAHRRERLDLAGAAVVTAGLLAGVFAITQTSWTAAAVGIVLLAGFAAIETRAVAPLIPPAFWRRSTVRWANLAGLVIMAMETGMIFLMTLYLQDVLALSPVVTGLVFGLPGLAAVAAGPIAGRLISRYGSHRMLTLALATQGLMVLPLAMSGTSTTALFVIIPFLFAGFFAHVTAIVSWMVVGTSGLPDDEQGLATGVTSMAQQVGITVGAPVMLALAASRGLGPEGVQYALYLNVAFTLAGALLVGFGLRAGQSKAIQSLAESDSI